MDFFQLKIIEQFCRLFNFHLKKVQIDVSQCKQSIRANSIAAQIEISRIYVLFNFIYQQMKQVIILLSTSTLRVFKIIKIRKKC